MIVQSAQGPRWVKLAVLSFCQPRPVYPQSTDIVRPARLVRFVPNSEVRLLSREAALPSITDFVRSGRQVSKVTQADSCSATKRAAIRSSGRRAPLAKLVT